MRTQLDDAAPFVAYKEEKQARKQFIEGKAAILENGSIKQIVLVAVHLVTLRRMILR